MAFAFSIANLVKGIIAFFISALGVYILHDVIFDILAWIVGPINLWTEIAVWVVLFAVVIIVPLAITINPGTEEV